MRGKGGRVCARAGIQILVRFLSPSLSPLCVSLSSPTPFPSTYRLSLSLSLFSSVFLPLPSHPHIDCFISLSPSLSFPFESNPFPPSPPSFPLPSHPHIDCFLSLLPPSPPSPPKAGFFIRRADSDTCRLRRKTPIPLSPATDRLPDNERVIEKHANPHRT